MSLADLFMPAPAVMTQARRVSPLGEWPEGRPRTPEEERKRTDKARWAKYREEHREKRIQDSRNWRAARKAA